MSQRPSASYGPQTPQDEILLGNGEISVVFRVGNTVRRPAGFWTPTVHKLLHHVRDEGFEEAPEPLGIDEQGREVLTFIDGDVASGDRSPPDYVWSDATLAAVAKILRRLHDATTSFREPAGARWLSKAREGDIICHNDFAPWNIVFRDGLPAGVIDWDLAAPGSRLRDMAWALWYFVPLTSTSSMSIPDRARRLRLFCDAYGLSDRSTVMVEVYERHRELPEMLKHLSEQGVEGYRRMWESQTWHESTRQDHRFLEDQRDALSVEL